MVAGWIAVVGPKGMAPELVKRINAAFVTAFARPEVKEAMAKQGGVAWRGVAGFGVCFCESWVTCPGVRERQYYRVLGV